MDPFSEMGGGKNENNGNRCLLGGVQKVKRVCFSWSLIHLHLSVKKDETMCKVKTGGGLDKRDLSSC